MTQASRTIVKSPPEVWAAVSDPATLARHLEAFGEIRITDLRPEAHVAWEAPEATGTVDLEAAGWGTRVTLRAVVAEPEPEPVAVAEPEPEPEPEAVAPGRLRRLWRSLTGGAAPAEPEPVPAPEPDPQPEPEAAPAPARSETEVLLDGVLDGLGAAHHRPFSR